ncbi:molybdate ABC transporter permease subunit [Commensalibacter papalotli (ex Botero et al. 2024)]|uniref:Molybdenum transport system permease n=1 Tax=Commensalibacter papalotli (ex Botero et al. 2024) TaxID=2972766 RepID=A0ABM9HR78_9PROT|nr:molybdate ABC transporter permease subunit [Commensalibacter papalotli (ex Botero et al. 2024)]CAI3943732.1 ABC-type molybdate transport system [Commensalibacter papalotli (ex Botero et al. 2024)]CAI3947161.1 ABC-type molybdate transport system [Commensalibacter papalotli (ex Botero et al. 2024)]
MNFAWGALLLSLKVAGCSVVVNFLIAVPIGFLLARKKFVGKEFLDTILTLPMVMPPTVLGYYLLVLLGRHGWVGQILEIYFDINLIFTWQGAVIAATIVTFPLVFKPTRTAFESVNPCYEQAARVLGVSDISIFFRITLPLAWRGIFAGLLLSFARALGEFGATLMVAGSIPGKTETLSISIYEAVQEGNDHAANIAVIILSFVCIVVLFIAKKLTGYKIFY